MRERRVSESILRLIPLLAWAFTATPAAGASLQQITNFGSNPSNIGMYVYVPNNVKAKPPILVAIHYCTGSAQAFYSGTEWASMADKYGFIVIYPSATRSGACFDVYTSGALTHNGNSDPVGIVSAVNYVIQKYNADSSQVFVTGASSGAMMTDVMLGDYPDVFKAGAAFMGVPFGCFATTDGSTWNSQCANGQITKTASAWGDLVRNAYPGYTGARPRVQLWHGTADATLNYNNFGEEIKQWTNVLGVSGTAVYTDTPQSTWTRTRYGDTGAHAPVEAYSLQGLGHQMMLNGQATYAITYFGLDGSIGGGGGGTPGGGGGGGTPGGGGGGGTTGPGTAISIAAGATSGTGSFVADNYYSGGSTYTNTATVTPPSGVPAAVFNSERYGAFTYTLSGYQPNSSWTVTLYFAETYLTAAGQRSFNVAINGSTVLSNFDIYSAAGGANIGVGKSFNVTASSSGQIVIAFQAGSAENPKVDGIVVAAGAPADTVPPSAPSNLTASSVGTTSVSLSWTKSTDNVSVASYTVYGQIGIGVLQAMGTTSSTSLAVSGLSPSTTYSFTVVATDPTGNLSASSNALSVTTSAMPDTQPPSTPTGLTVTGKTSTTVSLSWNASTDNSGVAAYDILSGSSVIGTTANTYVSLGNLLPNTTYTFSVRARDAAGNMSSNSSGVGVTTQPTADTTPPSTPILNQPVVSGYTVYLSWTASTDNSGVVAAYDIYDGSTLIGSTTSTSAAINNLSTGSHNLTVRARDQAGLISPDPTWYTVQIPNNGVDVTPPSAPGNLTWNASGGTVTLSWNASTDDVGVTGYELYYGNFFLGTFSDTSLALIGFKTGTPYVFTVKAHDAAGNVSQASNQATVLLQAGVDTTPPSAPTNLTSTNVTETSVSLRWTASTDDVGVVVYQIYAGTSVVGTVPASTSGTVSNLTSNTTYTFTVKAVDGANNVSQASNSLTVTTKQHTDTTAPSTPSNLTASNLTSSSVQLCWTPSTDDTGVAAYDVYSGSTLVASTTSTCFSLTGLNPGTTYTYYVRARDAAGNVSPTSSGATITTSNPVDTVPPSTPTGLSASSVTSSSAVLSWNASTDNVGVAAYDVYNGGGLAASTMSTSMAMAGLSPSTTYSFTVKARDTAGNTSAASSAVAVTTLTVGGGGGGGGGGGSTVSYQLNPPDPCYDQFWVSGCQSGTASSTCGGQCSVANNCSPPEDSSKSNQPMTFACMRDMLFSDEFIQAQKDDAAANGWNVSDPPFNYGVVGHDIDSGGIDTGTSTCCQCYQMIFESPEPGSPQPPNLPIPKPMIVQSFNTAAGGAKNFDIFMGAGGFGAFNGCVSGTYNGSQTTTFGHFPYSSFPGQYNTMGGIKFWNIDACKSNGVVTMSTLSSSACQSAIAQACNTATASSATVTNETRNSCIQSNKPESLYHQNWSVRVKRVECPVNLTRVTGCRLASQGLPQANPSATTASNADSSFKTGYTTTTMQDCCKPTCAWQDNVKGAGLTPSGNWNAFYSCDQNGTPITSQSSQ